MKSNSLLICCSLILALLISARSVSDQGSFNAGSKDPVTRGEQIFTSETFSGNGRVCSTCHEIDRFGTITPGFVQEKYASDPDGQLFRAIDSDDGTGASYERLLEHATFRVVLDLPERTPSGLGIRKCDDPASQTVVLHRGSPSVFNVALEQHIMHGAQGLRHQVVAFPPVVHEVLFKCNVEYTWTTAFHNNCPIRGIVTFAYPESTRRPFGQVEHDAYGGVFQ